MAVQRNGKYHRPQSRQGPAAPQTQAGNSAIPGPRSAREQFEHTAAFQGLVRDVQELKEDLRSATGRWDLENRTVEARLARLESAAERIEKAVQGTPATQAGQPARR